MSPCQGREPLLKYMRTYPRLSMSSLRDCSMPKWALMEAYLGVVARCTKVGQPSVKHPF